MDRASARPPIWTNHEPCICLRYCSGKLGAAPSFRCWPSSSHSKAAHTDPRSATQGAGSWRTALLRVACWWRSFPAPGSAPRAGLHACLRRTDVAHHHYHAVFHTDDLPMQPYGRLVGSLVDPFVLLAHARPRDARKLIKHAIVAKLGNATSSELPTDPPRWQPGQFDTPAIRVG